MSNKFIFYFETRLEPNSWCGVIPNSSNTIVFKIVETIIYLRWTSSTGATGTPKKLTAHAAVIQSIKPQYSPQHFK